MRGGDRKPVSRKRGGGAPHWLMLPGLIGQRRGWYGAFVLFFMGCGRDAPS
jgi:hypothetical protein